MDAEFTELKGKILSKIEKKDDMEIIFYLETGEKYRLFHEQDCCESVTIEDINGDLDDLIGDEILLAEEVSNDDFVKDFESNKDGYVESYTFTFYRLATKLGYVIIRWYGESNGYYSEDVSFEKIDYEI